MSYFFESNAQQFEITYETKNPTTGYHPYIGVSTRIGIYVMYRLQNDSQWLNINAFAYDSPVCINMSDYVDDDKIYEIMIYAPALSTLSKLEVEISDENYASIIKEIPENNIIVAGGPISHGVGCTSVNNMFSNILERNLDAYVYHITSSSKNYLEYVLNFYQEGKSAIADVIILELDYYGQNESVIEDTLPKIIKILKKRCKYLIGWYAIPEVKSFKKLIANNIISKYEEDENMKILDLSFIYDDEFKDMCTFNNWFINDIGNIIISKEIEECIRGLTIWNI